MPCDLEGEGEKRETERQRASYGSGEKERERERNTEIQAPELNEKVNRMKRKEICLTERNAFNFLFFLIE